MKKILGGMIAVFIIILAVFVMGLQTNVVVAPLNNTNVSGAALVLNATSTNYTVNVTFQWLRFASGQMELNTTVYNNTFNQSIFTNTSFNTTLLTDGVYNITVMAVNISGIEGTLNTTAMNITVDNTVPNVTIILSTTSSIATQNVSGVIYPNVTAFDNTTSVQSVIFQIDNGTTFQNWTGTNAADTGWNISLDTTNLSEGPHNITIFANDSLGNMNGTENITINVDNIYPVVVFTLPANNTNLTTTNQAFNITVADLGTDSVIFVFSNGTVPFNRTATNPDGNVWNVSNIPVTVFDEGVQSLIIFANDTAGNLNQSASINFTRDVSAPNVTFVSHVSSANVSGIVYFNATVFENYTDVNAVIFQFDNTSTFFNMTAVNAADSGWNISWDSTNFSDGSKWNVTIFANDTVGNVNFSQNVTVTLDNIAPTVVTVSPGNNTNYTLTSGLKDFNFTINDSQNLVTEVVLQFSNGTNPFNLTASNSTDVNWNVSFFNFTRLAEAVHTVTVFANDSAGNVNTSSYIIRYDNTNPSVSVSCTSNPAVGTTVTCTCTATDSVSSILSFGFQGGSSSATESTTASGSSGTSSTCSATDYTNHTASATGSWTVASSAGGSGSGGSSSGKSSTVTGVSEKKVWDSVDAGETGIIEVENGAIGVTELSFKVNDNIYGAWVKITKKDSFPSSVKDFGTGEYRKLEVTKSTTVKDEILGDIVIKFKVEKDWLTKESLSKSNVALYRFVGGKWTTLKTSLGTDDGTYIHYTAESPGFSYFVIGGKTTVLTPVAKKEIVTGATVTSDEVETSGAGLDAETEAVSEVTTEQALLKESGSNVWWVVLVLVILILGAGLLWWLSKKK
jgi:PGF-pre-PGF domain-containing protein